MKRHPNTVLSSYLENTPILLALHCKSRRHIDRSRRRRRTTNSLGDEHRGVNIAADSSSRPRGHDCLHNFGARHCLRRDSNRDVNSAGDDVALGDRRGSDGDGAGIGARCEDHVCALVGGWSSLAEAGFAGGGCADEHATVDGH